MRHKKKIFLAVFLACMGYIFSCLAAIPKQAPTMVPQRAAWLVYWDWQAGMQRASTREEQVFVAFAADFDKNDHLRLAEGVDTEALEKLATEKDKKIFLSFVNDRTNGKKQILKDTALLHRLLDKEYLRRRHIEEIINLAQKNKFYGVEIDYENIWQDETLVPSFVAFVGELKTATENAGLKLRVVLEPKTLACAASLPPKVDYVIMFYNLYGLHSGPGPKADEKFILRTLKKVEQLQGTPDLAFASGGYDWTEGKNAVGLTEKQARTLQEKYSAQAERDGASRALHFTYREKNKQHTVWYADEMTLAFWRSVAEKYGYQRFSLWRLE